VERSADWDAQWRAEPLDPAAVAAEERTPRWRAQDRIVHERLGGFAGLRAIEIGAGRGLNGLLYARRGAEVTLLDRSPLVLEQAQALASALALRFEPVAADVLDVPRELEGAFDVSMSFGLCEHFVGEERARVVAAHLELVRPGGVAFLGVPNRLAPFYRLWMGVLKARGTWPLGTEEPFSVAELAQLARQAGAEPLPATYGSFVASAVGHGVNQLLFKLGRRGLPVPQLRTPLLDRLAYELLVPVVRVAE
jgi:2-polyprenyl-3-methyl-5-hydroxy-6-metoxy-1,4-benzoquinol methylase